MQVLLQCCPWVFVSQVVDEGEGGFSGGDGEVYRNSGQGVDGGGVDAPFVRAESGKAEGWVLCFAACVTYEVHVMDYDWTCMGCGEDDEEMKIKKEMEF